MSINIWTDSMQHAALLGKPVLFTNWLIQRDIIPDGWYCYDLRGTHKSPSTRTTLVDHAADYLDAFISQVREAYGKLELFGPEHCEPNSYESLDYEGRVLVLSPDTLKESCWTPQNQLWLAHDGFGCSPHAVGRSIRCTCLGDGEQTRWNRTDFTGVLKEEFLPGWAREKLEELQGQNAGMGGMEMT